MSSAQSWDVYTGWWTNWNDGPILGFTLTTGSQWGLIMVSFIALWVGMIGGQMWGIVCFTLHQLRATREHSDGLYHQVQVILRNSQSPSSTAYEFLKMGWTWRHHADLGRWRVLPWIFVSMLQVTLFTVAGILSSEIFSTTNEVLLKRDLGCGVINLPYANHTYSDEEMKRFNAFFIELRRNAYSSSTYSKNCYGNDTGPTCQYFAVPNINSTFTRVPCPFDSKMCLDPDNAWQADSGWIHSNKHLGINTQPQYSFNYRRVMTCAPLVLDGYYEWTPAKNNDSLPGDQFLNVFYGNYTYADTTYLSYVVRDLYSANVSEVTAFPVDYLFHEAGLTDVWTPIPELARDDADITLVMLHNNLRYSDKVTDLWYNAENSIEVSDVTIQSSAYEAAAPLAVMGCTEQHQFCNPNIHGTQESCSDLMGWYQLGLPGVIKDVNPGQLSIGKTFYSATSGSLLNDLVFSLGSASLQAFMSLDGGMSRMSGPLPDGQWMTEVEGWQNWCLAQMQRQVVSLATGPTMPNMESYVTHPEVVNDSSIDPCAIQKIRDSRFYSFNALGMFTTIGTGMLLIVLNFTLPSIVGAFQVWAARRKNPRRKSQGSIASGNRPVPITTGLAKKEDWELDHILQLQRIAFEAHKLGTWARRESGIPITVRKLRGESFPAPARQVSAYERIGENDEMIMGGDWTMVGEAKNMTVVQEEELASFKRDVTGVDIGSYAGGFSDYSPYGGAADTPGGYGSRPSFADSTRPQSNRSGSGQSFGSPGGGRSRSYGYSSVNNPREIV